MDGSIDISQSQTILLMDCKRGQGQTMLAHLKRDLSQLSNPEKAKTLSGFFKTGKGQYGAGDVFLGIPVPEQRKVATRYHALPLPDLQALLSSPIHEHRLTALLILVAQYGRADASGKDALFRFYLNNTAHINNWDLVDLSAPKIVGAHLLNQDTAILYHLARSPNLWERRIAMLSTLTFIRHDTFNDALRIAELLLQDKHDLIHKAVGWMLREIGKRDQDVEERFLSKHYSRMPRTMLRYAIERFDAPKRQCYLTSRPCKPR
jgi:3-methyladenine DNA glycosylase AlkD